MILPIRTANMKYGNLIFLYNNLFPTISGIKGKKQNIANKKIKNLPYLFSAYFSRFNQSFVLFVFLSKYLLVFCNVRENMSVFFVSL